MDLTAKLIQKPQPLRDLSAEAYLVRSQVREFAASLDVKNLKTQFRSYTKPAEILPAVSRLLDTLNSKLEAAVGMGEGQSDKASLDYFTQPSLVARATFIAAKLAGSERQEEDLLLHQKLTQIVGSEPIFLRQLTDFGRYKPELSLHELAAAIFWEEVLSTLLRETEVAPLERLVELLPPTSNQRRQFIATLTEDLQDSVFAVRTADPLGCVHYSPVFVPTPRLPEFSEWLERNQTLELPAYAHLFATLDEAEFRQSCKNHANRNLARQVDAIASATSLAKEPDQAAELSSDAVGALIGSSLGIGMAFGPIGAIFGAAIGPSTSASKGAQSSPAIGVIAHAFGVQAPTSILGQPSKDAALAASSALGDQKTKTTPNPNKTPRQENRYRLSAVRIRSLPYPPKRLEARTLPSLIESPWDNFILRNNVAWMAATLIKLYGYGLSEFSIHLIDPLRTTQLAGWRSAVFELGLLAEAFGEGDRTMGWDNLTRVLLGHDSVRDISSLRALLGDIPETVEYAQRLTEGRAVDLWNALVALQFAVSTLSFEEGYTNKHLDDLFDHVVRPAPMQHRTRNDEGQSADRDGFTSLVRAIRAKIVKSGRNSQFNGSNDQQNVYENQSKIRVSFYHLKYSYQLEDIEYKILHEWVSVNGIKPLCDIEKLRFFIQESENSKPFIREMLSNSLEPVFARLSVPDEAAEALLDELTDRLFDPDPKRERRTQSWAERVGGAKAKAEAIELPDAPPATWKADKQKGDKPPDFLKRHYGPEGLDVLRSDGTGMSRSDLRDLDPSLYTALSNWLRKNELPEDCPIPTRSEVVSAFAERADPNTLRLARTLVRRNQRDSQK